MDIIYGCKPCDVYVFTTTSFAEFVDMPCLLMIVVSALSNYAMTRVKVGGFDFPQHWVQNKAFGLITDEGDTTKPMF
jgi:hypothetical protein